MSDVIDRGSAIEQQLRDTALQIHQLRLKKLSSGICVECEIAIPQSRLQANSYAERCLECQEIFEFKSKIKRRVT